MKRESVY